MIPSHFRISNQEIEKLSDVDLRELVRRLCVAEMRRCRLPLSSVVAGGHQNAADGGIDVMVQVRADLAGDAVGWDFVPRSSTGYQAKATDMPPSAIDAEMRPGEALRPAIRDLAAARGSYILISSQGTLSPPRLKERIDAMERAVATDENSDKIFVSFYDRDRIADWVNSYSEVALWLRELLGRPVSGWKAHGNWAHDVENGELISDGSRRLTARFDKKATALTAVEGIERIRASLRRPGSVIRIVGLSGVGKTRFSQAIFDRRIEAAVADDTDLYYVDAGSPATPSPIEMVRLLAAEHVQATIVVDNCAPELHRQLRAEVALAPRSLRLLTVDHDVGIDEPPETEVYELMPLCAGVIESILERRAPELPELMRAEVTRFADGNARIALGLANGVGGAQSLGTLTDQVALKRLLFQREPEDPNLLRAAQTISLVYSFDATPGGAEADVLAGLADLKPRQLQQELARLEQKMLLQRRSNWAALLPPAFANRMAEDALRWLSVDELTASFPAGSRLLESFAHRMGFLNERPKAVAVATHWMTAPSSYSRPQELDQHGLTVYQQFAPLVPALALQQLEAAAPFFDSSPSGNPLNRSWALLIRKLAYEAIFFERSARLLLRLAMAARTDKTFESLWLELFHMDLSGTLAPVEQRICFLKTLLASDDEDGQDLILLASAALLESWHFTSTFDSSFGARPRSNGWEPEGREQFVQWFEASFAFIESLCRESSPHRERMRSLVSDNVRSLLASLSGEERLLVFLRNLIGPGGWTAGWISINASLTYDGAEMPTDWRLRVENLERDLRPVGVAQNLRAYVLTPYYEADGVLEASEDPRVDPKAEFDLRASRLGEEVGRDPLVLRDIAPLLFGPKYGQQFAFAQGLSSTCTDVVATWELLVGSYARQRQSDQHSATLGGFVRGIGAKDSPAAEALLDSAFVDQRIAKVFPEIQSAYMTRSAVARLFAALDLNLAPASAYAGALASSPSVVAEDDLEQLIIRIGAMAEGTTVAISAASKAIRDGHPAGRDLSSTLLRMGRTLLRQLTFPLTVQLVSETDVAKIVTTCLRGDEWVELANGIWARMIASFKGSRAASSRSQTLARALVQVQPRVALDQLLRNDDTGRFDSWLAAMSARGKNLVNDIPEEILIEWASLDPEVRAPLLAREVHIVSREHGGPYTLASMAGELLAMVVDTKHVLGAFEHHFKSTVLRQATAEFLVPYQQMTANLRVSAKQEAVRIWADAWHVTLLDRMAAKESYARSEHHVNSFGA